MIKTIVYLRYIFGRLLKPDVIQVLFGDEVLQKLRFSRTRKTGQLNLRIHYNIQKVI